VRLFVYEFISAGGLGPKAPASLRREGWAMLRAVAEDFARIGGSHVSTLVDEHCPRPPGHACRRTAPIRLLDPFRECAANADATLVIAPEFDEILARTSQSVLDAGRQLLGSLPPAIEHTGDKRAMHQHWQRQGIRTPGTVDATAAPPCAFGPPWVCKPRQGAGSQATILVREVADWPIAYAQASAEWPSGGLLAQRFVPGIAASVSFLVGPGRSVSLLPAAQTLSDDGRFRYEGGRVPLPVPLQERAGRLARSALGGIDGLQGYVGVDLVLGSAPDGSGDYAIEINPRLTTSYIGLRTLCRDNLAKAWCDVLAGRDVRLTWRDGVVEFDADGMVRA
jgi:predicted ATP-grasp superfamily ATP-dependent carboligase